METSKMWDEQSPIEGRLVQKKTEVGDNNSNVYVLEVGEEMVGVWGSTVLDTKFKGIAVGQLVGIDPLGKKKGRSGREYKDYWVGWANDGEALSDHKEPISEDDLPF